MRPTKSEQLVAAAPSTMQNGRKGEFTMKTKGSKCLTWVQRLQLESLIKAKV